MKIYIRNFLIIVPLLIVSALHPNAATDYTYYPQIPPRGAQITFQNSSGDLHPIFYNMHSNTTDELKLGDLFVYGNGIEDSKANNSFDKIKLEFGAPQSIGSFALVLVENFGQDKYSYYVYVAQSDKHTISIDGQNEIRYSHIIRDNLIDDFKDFKDVLEYTAENGTTEGTFASEFTQDTYLNQLYLNTTIKGDPDVMEKTLPYVYVYYKDYDKNEFAKRVRIINTKTDYESELYPLDNVKISVRATNTIINIVPSPSDKNIIGYNIHNENTDEYFFTTDTTFKYQNSLNERNKFEVTSVNAINDESKEFNISGEKASQFDTANILTDISGNTFEYYIDLLYKYNLIDGYSDLTYKPDEYVTRGQLAKFVANSFKILQIKSLESPFTDISESDTFYNYIIALESEGIISGYSDNTFRSDEYVTRGAATKYIYNAARYYNNQSIISSSNCDFADVDGHAFETYICSLHNFNGDYIEPIISGYTNGNFGPDDPLTRGQMAKIIMNAAAQIEVDKDYAGPDGIMGTADDGDDIWGLDFGNTNDTFINVFSTTRDFIRPYIKPAKPTELFSTPVATTSATIDWYETKYSGDDLSIDGYIIEICEEKNTTYCEKESNWDPIEGEFGSFGGEKQLANININNAIASQIYGIQINGNGYSYPASTGDSVNDIVKELSSLIIKNKDTNVTTGSGSFLIEANVPGFELEIVNTSSSVGNIDIASVSDNNFGYSPEYGVINLTNDLYAKSLISDEDISTASVSIFELNDDSAYNVRISAFKFIPYEYTSDTSLDSQMELEDSRYFKNKDYMLTSEWSYYTVETKDY